MRPIKIFALLLSILFTGDLSFSQTPALDFSNVPGTVVRHSPASSGIYLGSPSMEVMPSGNYIASCDLFGPGYTSSITTVPVYKSTDKGASWKVVTEIKSMFWSKLFYHKNALYLIGVDGIGGRLAVRKSTDEGATWSVAKDSTTGIISPDTGYHTAPMPVIVYRNRIWKAAEHNDTSFASGWITKNFSFMMSAPVDADLLHASSWTISDGMLSPHWNKGFPWLEGNAVFTPNGKLAVINRVHSNNDDTASYYEVSDDGTTIDKSSLRMIRLPGACKKFTIRYDEKSKLYWSLSNHSPKKLRGINHVERTRSTVALIYSTDLTTWRIKAILLSHPDVVFVGFQYLDWFIEGNDIVALSRTAYHDGVEKANDCHNANFITFHRFKNFREAKTSDTWADLEE